MSIRVCAGEGFLRSDLFNLNILDLPSVLLSMMSRKLFHSLSRCE